jgi:class 3 adenylate cyclase
MAPPSASWMRRTPPPPSESIVGAAAPAVDSGLQAVMFTDIVGSTEMTARLGDSAALELVRAHDALVRRGPEAYGGREISSDLPLTTPTRPRP